jgi:hypothetical protein
MFITEQRGFAKILHATITSYYMHIVLRGEGGKQYLKTNSKTFIGL